MANTINIFLEEYCNKIRRAGEELRLLQMPTLTEELFALYENTGNRLKYEAVYFLRRKFLAVFGMLSILYKEKEDIIKLEEVLTDICSEECWALPPHVNRENNKEWRITIDLFASETAQAITEISTLLQNELSGDVKELVKQNVLDRVINPFYKSGIPYSNWEICSHNWCAVCAGSIGSASIYLFSEEEDTLNQYLERICNSLTHYIDGFSDDGTCMEGIGYFTYGMTYYTTFADQIFEYTKGKTDLLSSDKLRCISEFQQKCYFKGGRTINFSDGSSHDSFKMGMTAYLSLRFPTVFIPNMNMAAEFDTDPCFRWAAIYRDYIWTKKYSEGHKDMTKKVVKDEYLGQVILPDAGWSICQSGNGAGFAIKGGHNAEPHNHNDIGSFLYVNQKDMLLAELGSGEYTKDYFNDNRYTILCNSSLGHSVPIINGKGQQAGRAYACRKFIADGCGKSVLEIGGAYEEGTVDLLERTAYFNLENGVTMVEDIFIGQDKLSHITENLITCCKPAVQENIVFIQGEHTAINVVIENLEDKINIVMKNHYDHSGNEVIVYLIQWEVPVTQGNARSKFVIYPEG